MQGRLGKLLCREGVGACSFGKVLMRGSSGSAVFWGGDVGDFGYNGVEVIRSACGFPAADNKAKGK